MAIEFPCPGCQKLLRVQDDSAGKNAKCPQCGTIAPVPATSSFPGGTPAVPPAPPIGSPFGTPSLPTPEINPYSSPTTATTYRPEFTGAGTVPGGAIRPSRIDIGRVINSAWFVFKRDLGICVLAAFIVGVVNMIFQIPFNICQSVLQARPNDEELQIMVFGIMGVFWLVGMVVQLWLGLGVIKFYLRVVRSSEKPDIADLFRGSGLLSAILATIVLVIGMVMLVAVCIGPALITPFWLILGAPLLIVGYVYVMLTTSQYMYLIVDRRLPAFDALSTSATITQGNRLMIFVLGLVGGGIMLLGVLACCVGVLFAIPLVGLVGTVAYLHMIGESTPE